MIKKLKKLVKARFSAKKKVALPKPVAEQRIDYSLLGKVSDPEVLRQAKEWEPMLTIGYLGNRGYKSDDMFKF